MDSSEVEAADNLTGSSPWKNQSLYYTPAARHSSAGMHSNKMASHDMSMTALQMEDEVHGPTAPDPTNNLNPQNWSPWKKRFLFCALLSSSILCDGSVMFVLSWA